MASNNTYSTNELSAISTSAIPKDPIRGQAINESAIANSATLYRAGRDCNVSATSDETTSSIETQESIGASVITAGSVVCSSNRSSAGEQSGSSAINGTHVLLDDGSCLNLIYRGKGLRFPCICKEAFPTYPGLERHLVSCASAGSHNSVGQYRCVKCMAVSDSINKVSGHFKSCKGPREPGEESQSAPDRRNRSAPKELKFKCRFCERLFGSVTGQGLHEKRSHLTQTSQEAKSCKRSRWTEAETDTLLQAEARKRLKLTPEESSNLNETALVTEIHQCMRRILPSFNRRRVAHVGSA